MPTAAGQSKVVNTQLAAGIAEPGQSADYQAGEGGNENQHQGAQQSANPGDAVMDHVDAINQLFAQFEFAYHNQYHKAFADADSLIIAKKYWLSCLNQFSPVQIVAAAKRVIRSQEYLPSIAVVVKACDSGLDLYGLPSTREAYLEACSASSPKLDFQWSHAAVYFAGKASDWFFLANYSEQKTLPVFDYHYSLLCKRVISGETLSLEMPVALSEKSEKLLSGEQVQARIKVLRKELNL
ncbi:MAG: hypothetical protein COC19_08640 [SAR86 cluster bacterium]|uniref:Replicative helicase inhibitor G39P N-terminal domain-containing protein n=1 Tax=SAR86 cluster bacterium TaxID=2030880 RepID=A0A2A4MDE3_9GAMM|nr:MAG: hypothetical protein COC19_08640 [SAR86 cluster bacterium]